jgi:hypothetical protein
MPKQRGRREQTLPRHASQPQSSRTTDHPRAIVALAHRHGRGHLTSRGGLRCGCGRYTLGAENNVGDLAVVREYIWLPRRRQLAGFVLTRFIYSDRMLCPSV